MPRPLWEPVQPQVNKGGITIQQSNLALWPKPKTRLQAFLHFFVFSNKKKHIDTNKAMIFDTDSFAVAFDTQVQRSMSNEKNAFKPGSLVPVSNVYAAGVGGNIPATHKGILQINIEEDKGKDDSIKDKEGYLVPDLPITLISPQEWAAQCVEKYCKEDDPHMFTTGDYSCLSWNGGQSILTIPHDPETNLPIWRSAPGYKKAASYRCHHVKAYSATVTDDEASDTDADSADEGSIYLDDDTIPLKNKDSKVRFLILLTSKAIVVWFLVLCYLKIKLY